MFLEDIDEVKHDSDVDSEENNDIVVDLIVDNGKEKELMEKM